MFDKAIPRTIVAVEDFGCPVDDRSADAGDLVHSGPKAEAVPAVPAVPEAPITTATLRAPASVQVTARAPCRADRPRWSRRDRRDAGSTKRPFAGART